MLISVRRNKQSVCHLATIDNYFKLVETEEPRGKKCLILEKIPRRCESQDLPAKQSLLQSFSDDFNLIPLDPTTIPPASLSFPSLIANPTHLPSHPLFYTPYDSPPSTPHLHIFTPSLSPLPTPISITTARIHHLPSSVTDEILTS